MEAHDLDVISLVFGIAFTGIGITFLAVPVDVTTVPWGWLWPVVLIALGAAVLVPVLRRRGSPAAVEPHKSDELANPEELREP